MAILLLFNGTLRCFSEHSKMTTFYFPGSFAPNLPGTPVPALTSHLQATLSPVPSTALPPTFPSLAQAQKRVCGVAPCWQTQRFKAATFSDQRQLWKKAPESLRQQFEAHGHCKEGLWSAFARQARLASKKGKKSVETMTADVGEGSA